MSKTISILGSTGSIGRQTLEVAEQLGLTVAAITAHNRVELAEEQARKFRPRLAASPLSPRRPRCRGWTRWSPPWWAWWG